MLIAVGVAGAWFLLRADAPSVKDYFADVQEALATTKYERDLRRPQIAEAEPNSAEDIKAAYLRFVSGYLTSSDRLLGALRELDTPDGLGEVHNSYVAALAEETEALTAYAEAVEAAPAEDIVSIDRSRYAAADAAEDEACGTLEREANARGFPLNPGCDDGEDIGPGDGASGAPANTEDEEDDDDDDNEERNRGRGNGRDNGNDDNDDD